MTYLNNKLLDNPMPNDSGDDEIHILGFIFILFFCVVLGIILGIFGNLIHGLVSPIYFMNIMGLQNEDLAPIVLIGAINGLWNGFIFGFLFSFIYGAVSRLKGDTIIAMIQILKTVPLILKSWMIVGIIAMILFYSFPDIYRDAIIDVPLKTGNALKYAFVGGGIWGLNIGSIIALPISLIWAYRAWKESKLG